MKKIFKIIPVLALLGSTQVGYSQNVDLSVTSTSDKGTFDMSLDDEDTVRATLYNFSSQAVTDPGAVALHIVMPVGIIFEPSAATAHPPGWSDGVIVNGREIIFKNTGILPPLAADFSHVHEFAVPFKMMDTMTDKEFYAAYQYVPPFLLTYSDPNPNNNGGNYIRPINVIRSIPLAADFKRFDATANGCDVRLQWVMAKEEKGAYFMIQKATNGSSFEDIEKVAALGAENAGNIYLFEEAGEKSLTAQYRIKYVSVEGKETFTNIKRVNTSCGDIKPSLSLYPNPAISSIRVKGLTTDSEVEIFNVLGQKVKTVKVNTQNDSIDLEGLVNGNYSARIVSNGVELFKGSFVKKD